MTCSTLQHLRTTADRMTLTAKSMGLFDPRPEPPVRQPRTGPSAYSDEEIQNARALFTAGATFRRAREQTGMSMDFLKKIKEGRR